MTNDNIQKIHDLILKTPKEEGDVSELLDLLNDYFKQQDVVDQKRYVLTWLFADWHNQDNMGNSIPALMFLKILNELLKKIENIKDNHDYVSKIEEIISFEKLRDEFTNVLEESEIPEDIVRFPRSWQNFVELITTTVLDHPLTFPDPNNKLIEKLYGKQMLEQIRRREGVISLNITKFDKAILEGKAEKSDEKVTCLVIMTSDGSKIVVPL